MGGIISGFLGGVGKGAADVGRIMLIDKLDRERAEANASRDAALRRELQIDSQEFATSEREAKQEYGTKEREATQGYTAAEKQKDRDASMDEVKYQTDNKPAKNPQLIKYTDAKGNEQEGILQRNKDGSFTIVKPDTGEVIEEEITAEELKTKAAQINTNEGRGNDWIPFNEYDWKDDRVRSEVAADRQSGKSAKPVTTKGGIVNAAANATQDATTATAEPAAPAPKAATTQAPQAALDALKANPALLPQFIKKYGYDPTKQ